MVSVQPAITSIMVLEFFDLLYALCPQDRISITRTVYDIYEYM